MSPALLAGCGVTGSKSSGSDHSAACAYVAKLDEIADGVGRADVHDPDAFKKTLDDAVQEYVTNVESLRAVAPAELRATLDRVESDVKQYRFSAAVTDRADLDAYAQHTCGLTALGAGGTTVPGSTVLGSTVPESTVPGSTVPGSTDSLPVTSTSFASTPPSSGLSSGG
jgi:hypothetical protein